MGKDSSLNTAAITLELLSAMELELETKKLLIYGNRISSQLPSLPVTLHSSIPADLHFEGNSNILNHIEKFMLISIDPAAFVTTIAPGLRPVICDNDRKPLSLQEMCGRALQLFGPPQDEEESEYQYDPKYGWYAAS